MIIKLNESTTISTDVVEHIDFTRNDIIVYIEDGSIAGYVDENCNFAKFHNKPDYPAEIDSRISLADNYSIVEDFEDLIYSHKEWDKLIPRKDGTYKMSFSADMTYIIENVHIRYQAIKDYAGKFGDEIEYSNDMDIEYFIDDAYAVFDKLNSKILNLTFIEVQ